MKEVEPSVAELAALPRTVLATRWEAVYGTPPPKGISQRLMLAAVTYACQTQQHGGLGPSLSRRLAKLAGGARTAEVVAPRVLRPGARLVREWSGTTHTVEVVAGGYVWNGARYRSLSSVARAITGARWSGPRFFGLGK